MSSATLMDCFSVMLFNSAMDTIEITRVKRLAILKKEFGSYSVIADVTDISESQLSQWANQSPDSKTGRPRVMHSDSARKIEKGCNKLPGWMDQPVYENQNKQSEKPMVNTDEYSMEKLEFIEEIGPMNNQEFNATKGLFKAAGIVVKTSRRTKKVKGAESDTD